MVIFAVLTVFWLFLTIGTLLVHGWYSLGRHVAIGTPMVIFAVLTVFWLFLTIGALLVYCWYSLGRHVTIGTPMVIFAALTVFWLFLTNGTLYQSAKTLKTIVVPIVTGLPRLYQQCTNRQKQSKDSQNSKYDHWCTNRHMSILDCTNSVPTRYQSSKTVETNMAILQQQQFLYSLYSYVL